MKQHRHCLVLAISMCLLLFSNTDAKQTVEPEHSLQAPTALMQDAPSRETASAFYREPRLYRWNEKNRFIMVYIQRNESLVGWRPQNEQIVQAAFREWQQALQNRLIFVFTSDPRQSDVIVSWWQSPPEDLGHDACGYQSVAFWDRYMARNDIFLSLHGRQSTDPWPPEKLHAFALHEIGHLLGLSDHSDSPNDIMAGVIQHQTHLSPRDINTVQLLYQTQTTYTNPTGYHLAQFEQFKQVRLAALNRRPTPWPILSVFRR